MAIDRQQQPEFFAELLALAEALDVELSDRRMEIYWRVLEEYDWPTVQRALAEGMRRKWYKFPQPGELVELIEGPRKDEAEHAWTQIQELVRDYGAEYPLACYDPAFAEAIAIFAGDWIHACQRIEAISEQYHKAAARAKQESMRAEREVRQQWLKEEEGLHWAFVHAYQLAQGRQSCVSATIYPGLDDHAPVGIQRGRPPWILEAAEQYALQEGIEDAGQPSLDARGKAAQHV